MADKEQNLTKIWKEYAQAYFMFTPSFQKELLQKAGNNVFGNILDAGCGVGKLVSKLNNFNNYTGIDSNKFMLKVANENLGKINNIKFKEGDICNLDFPSETFDSYSSLNVLYSVNNSDKLLSEAYRVLKQKGKLILASPNHSLNMNELEAKLIAEFKPILNQKSKKIFDRYIEINHKLAGNSSFKPKLFSESEIITLLEKVGFQIIKKETAYLEQLFLITCLKS